MLTVVVDIPFLLIDPPRALSKVLSITLTLILVPRVRVVIARRLFTLRLTTLPTLAQLAIINLLKFYRPCSILATSYPSLAVGILLILPNEVTMSLIFVLIVVRQGSTHLPNTCRWSTLIAPQLCFVLDVLQRVKRPI